MMKKDFIFFFCFISLLFSLSFAQDRGYGVEVRSTSPELLEIEPGRIVTGSFLVSNKTQGEEEFIEELKLPAGWQEIISDQFPLRLKPEEQRVRVVAFMVPQTCATGRYQIGYSIRSERDYNITDSDSISVVVLPVMKLEILVEGKPEVVIAGDAYGLMLRLVNKGNSKIDLRFKIKSTPTYPVSIKPPVIALEAGKSQVLKVEVETDAKLKKRIKNVLEIKAETEDSSNGVVSVSRTVLVEIIPKVTDEFGRYLILPSQVALMGAGQDGKNGLQAELSGRGSLDEEGKRGIDFLFRGPDIQEISRRGRRDEYRLSYHYDDIQLHFGDGSYSLSPLTQKFCYGRGLEANISPERYGLKVFYAENRWSQPKLRRVGTSLSYQFTKKLNIKGNFLTKRNRSTSSSWSYDEKLYSLESKVELAKTLNLDLELGYCDTEGEQESGELAFRINLDGQLSDQIRYSYENIYAGPNYFGYYNDADYKSSTITFPIYRKLRGNFSYRSYKNNLDIDSTKETANREKSRQASAFYSFPFGTHISLKYEDLIREDCVLPVNYNYKEKTLKLEVAQTFGKFSLRTHVERGEFEDRLLATKNNNLERYSLYLHFRPSYGQTYSLYTRTGHSSFTGSPKKTKTIDISGSWNIKDEICISLNFRRDESGSEGSQKLSNIFSTLNYTLPNNHALVLRSQWSKYEQKQKGEFSFLLMYTIPLRIPVSKKKSIGVLKGKVYDQEKPEKPPIPKVILTANEATAITRENGGYIFPSLEPGTYYLRVDKASIGFNRVTTRKLPVIIEVKGGETITTEIGVVTSCKFSGRVAIFALPSDKKLEDKVSISEDSLFLIGPGKEEKPKNDDLREGRGLGNILVEITDGEEVLRQLTDEKGRFSFEDIRPGKWKLKIYDYNLPTHHYLEQEEFQLDLKPGEEREITVKVLPRHRPIQIIDEGKIKQENKQN